MPPRENEPPIKSSVAVKYPSHREEAFPTLESWFNDRKRDDGAEGLWRIHDELYDLSSFIHRHPGGADWLQLTKGTDITEAFESHHLSTLADEMLPNYYERKAKTPRNYSLTFHEDGFYKTIKRRARELLKTVPKNSKKFSIVMTDILLIGYVTTALLSVVLKSYWIGAMSGIFLALMATASHNFFHQRDNFRMFYFDLSLMSSREWRVSHVLSHHLYPNTVYDLEITLVEPFLMYLPIEKHLLHRIITWVFTPITYSLMFMGDYIRRILSAFKDEHKMIGKEELFPWIVPILMCFIGGEICLPLKMWAWIICVGSFYFSMIGFNAAHHHPKIFHDGDAARKDRDWGLFQMDALSDRPEINASQFLVLTSFGDHTLHHLFPTLDHAYLHHLYPALLETCKDFGVQFRKISIFELVLGQFLQLMRVRPNPNAPDDKTVKNGANKSLVDIFKPYTNFENLKVD